MHVQVQMPFLLIIECFDPKFSNYVIIGGLMKNCYLKFFGALKAIALQLFLEGTTKHQLLGHKNYISEPSLNFFPPTLLTLIQPFGF